jgi:Ser/Thr protein kinase RdoA (MazF antagonist)
MQMPRISAIWPALGGQVTALSELGTVLRIVSGSGVFFLKRRPSVEHAAREIDLLWHLRSRDLPVPEYLPTLEGKAFAALGTASEAGGSADRHCDDRESGRKDVWYLYRALPGEHFESFHGKLGLSRARRVGHALARLHVALADIPNSIGFERAGADPQMLGELGAAGDLYDLAQAARISGRRTPWSSLPEQLIHRDFHLYNLLFTAESLSGYLDFDLAQRGPRLFDVCYCGLETLAQRFDEPGFPDYWFRVLGALLKGYSELVELTDLEKRSAISMMLDIQLLAMHHFRAQPVPGRNAERLLHWLDARRHLIQSLVMSV